MIVGLLILMIGEQQQECCDQRFKSITCEKCGTRYGYVMSRSTSGNAFIWFQLFKKKAQQRAMRDARQQMDRLLEREAELVPCPQCMWVNQSLVNDYVRRFRLRPVQQLILLGAGLLASLLAWVIVWALLEHFYSHRRDWVDAAILSGFLLMGLLTPLWIEIGLMLYRRRINPNRHWPDHPPIIPRGTPRPILEADREADLHFMEEVVVDDPSTAEGSKWTVIDWNRYALLPYCCQCMEPADDSTPVFEAMPVKMLKVYWCKACQKKFKRYRVITMALPVLISAGLTAWIVYLSWPQAQYKTIAMTLVALFLANIFLIATLEFFLLPCRVKWVDKHRNIVAIRSVNPQYNQLLQEMAGKPMAFTITDDGEMF